MGKHHRHHKSKNTVGKIITLVQLVASGTLTIMFWNSGMVPEKYLIPLAVLLAALFAATFSLQFMRKPARILGIVLSVVISAAMITGVIAFNKVNSALSNVGGATYKTDNMIVVVRKDDPAENIMDAYNYRFGTQTSIDQKNNDKMLDDIESVIGRKPKIVEYETLPEMAEALLWGRVDAVVYNEAFDGIIEEAVEDYADNVRVLYQYGIDTEITKEETDIEKPFNVYISGIDVSGPITTNSRSDVNIIMTVNPSTKKILLTTTPRDFYVPIPGVSGGQRDKLTHAGIYGVDTSMATLEALYNIDISYYARVNFTSLITIVDALGGVDVNSEYEFSVGEYNFKKGVNHLDGQKALAFSRERHSFEAGDNQRGKNQEAVLTAILQKAMSPSILTSANEILASVSDCVETNMTREEMAKFINMQLADGASWNISSEAATGSGDKQACYSSGSQKLYVMHPNEVVVADLSGKMQRVLTGE